MKHFYSHILFIAKFGLNYVMDDGQLRFFSLQIPQVDLATY
jgi:hypothetical protein